MTSAAPPEATDCDLLVIGGGINGAGIARDAEYKIRKMKLNSITSPMVREIVAGILLERGMEDERKMYARVGMPVYDVQQIIAMNALDLALYWQAQVLFRTRLRQQSQAAPAMDWNPETVFAPHNGNLTSIADIPGRQGFYEYESDADFSCFAHVSEKARYRLFSSEVHFGDSAVEQPRRN